jgi:CubicO group peptidase (beta-lactamase class C family)
MADDGFARLGDVMRGYVERKEIPGALTLVQRRGEIVHCAIHGFGDDEGAIAMQRDSLFRIGSMTKPIISVAALTLLEEGKIRLRDSVDAWLPELAQPKVLTDPLGPLSDTYPAARSITVEDLLTHRPGIATALVAQGPIGQAVQVLTKGWAQRSDMTPDAWMQTLGSLPLAHPPGHQVINGFATDVLGVLISRISGMPLEDFLRERIFAPLGMNDTSFWVPQEKIGRLMPAYVVRWLSGKRVQCDHPRDSVLATPPAFPSGSSGLISTVDDYLKFANMLMNGGTLQGARVLSRETVELMTTNFLTPEQRKIPFFGTNYWADRGLGLGVFVLDNLAEHAAPGSIGQYGWHGAFATSWFNDPREELIAIMMTQVVFPAVVPPIRKDFETLVYQALDD